MVGNILGNRYEVLERVGTGGMSLVYRARDITLNRLVAVKILKHQWAEDADVVHRFEQEARAAASLVDPHIVQVYDVGRDEPDIHYMVMELVAGETLRTRLDREAPLPATVAMEIADQVAMGLEMAHARKLVHRDIKPQNILITPQGEVKVTDFGIAYAATTGTLVNTGSLLGTVQYLSPEQARGKLIGPQSDLYSLGVVLFEMLTGTLPFESESAIGVAIKHLQDDPPRIDVIRPEVPALVADIVERALSKDPAERYQSAHALRQDIARFLNAGGGGAVPVLGDAEGSQPGDSRGVDHRKRRRWLWYVIMVVVLLLLVGGGAYAFNRWINAPLESVPNLHGRTVAQARQTLKARNLTLSLAGHAPSNSVGKGRVLTESPQPGSKVKSGQAVAVVVSEGRAPVRVPGVSQEPVSLAKQSLKLLGLHWRIHHVSSAQASGEVVRQSPVGNSSVRQGSTVTLWVSNGANQSQVVMPNLIGFTVSQASGLLSGDNVTLNSPSRAWSTQPANTIMDQSPAPYSSLAGVAAVSVTVSNGPSPLSASLPANKSVVQITIPSSAAAKSLLKVVVTDQADNQEVYYQQVNPGQVVSYPVDWYGNNGQMMVYINGQAEPAKALTTNPSSSPSGTSPSTAPSSPASGG